MGIKMQIISTSFYLYMFRYQFGYVRISNIVSTLMDLEAKNSFATYANRRIAYVEQFFTTHLNAPRFFIFFFLLQLNLSFTFMVRLFQRKIVFEK
jgi:hypothetical protein